ncbi:tetratricopeptide repeat protein [Litoribacter alkaliphilus]|uniref:Tetratricopeptide repeat protein n=2 Tax=Litoribacter ruber TaxID=702568 RepID=A0AAP2G3K1_9BACT|nr:tetratricopeptide repeat protein [Litoribacter alkaliphilus]
MKAKSALLGVLSFMVVGMVQAQGTWNWPEDPEKESKAREYNAAYNDYLKSGEFVAATKPLNWLLTNAPDLNEALYINGVKVYDGAQKAVDDADQKKVYQDSVMVIYDKRNELYDNEDRWIENKAYYGYQYFKDDKDRVGGAVEDFDRAIEIHGSISHTLTPAYFDLVRRHYLMNKSLSTDDLLDKLAKVTEIIDNAEAEGTDVATQRGQVEQLVVAMDLIDCDFIENKLGPRLKAEPENIKLAQQIFQYSVKYKCTSTEAFTASLEIIDNDDPTFSTSQVRGMRYMQNQEYDRAIELFEKALTLAANDEQKGDVHYDIAKAYSQKGQKSSARSSAKKAAELNSNKATEAWTLIGNLYMQSSQECRGGQSRVKDYSIFIAAYDAFRRAGDNSGMSNAKARFPSKEELFTEGYEVGQTINTGCWIGENVTLATRD